LSPIRLETTGARANVRRAAQIRIALEHIRDRGGAAPMHELYAAVEGTMRSSVLSAQGRATLREYINRGAKDAGYVRRDSATKQWRITPLGLAYLDEEVLVATRSGGRRRPPASGDSPEITGAGAPVAVYDSFVALLTQATKQIEPSYFRLDVANAPSMYRERVYCYELYHQLRIAWPSGTPFVLHGEVDKRRHPILGHWAWIPDLVVHEPGNMDQNLLVIEVKSVDGARSDADVLRDLTKLHRLVTKGGYARGVFLLFGEDAAALRNVRRCASDWILRDAGAALDRLELLWHGSPRTAAVRQPW
jgi:hypothetical protein